MIYHDDVIKWKHIPRHWPFVWGSHRWIPHTKGQWRGALMFSLICSWINGWVNSREAGDLKRGRTHYDVIVMFYCMILAYTRPRASKDTMQCCKDQAYTSDKLWVAREKSRATHRLPSAPHRQSSVPHRQSSAPHHQSLALYRQLSVSVRCPFGTLRMSAAHSSSFSVLLLAHILPLESIFIWLRQNEGTWHLHQYLILLLPIELLPRLCRC